MKRSFWIVSAFLIMAITAWAQESTIIRKNVELCAGDCTWDPASPPARWTCVNRNETFTATVICPPGKVRKDPIHWSATGIVPSGETHNGTPATGSGNSFPTLFKTPGTKQVVAECGECGSITWNVTVLKIEITEPNDDPVTDNHFTFNKADPGVCNVVGTGTSGVAAEDASLEWELTSITGSDLTSTPAPPKGPNMTFTYTKLPALNSQFGNKTLTLKHPKAPDDCKDTQTVQIFFDGSDDATNHPGAGAGTTPNWFFYWCQTTAGFGSPGYNPGQQWGSIKWENNAWVAVLGHGNNGDYTPPAGGDNGGNLLNGIDHFAWVCRHEGRHVQTSTAWYPNGYDGNIDQDGDWMPDATEPALGGTPQNPINGGPFNPAVTDTDADGMRDDEDYTVATQTAWTEGSADGQDWSNTGHQSNK